MEGESLPAAERILAGAGLEIDPREAFSKKPQGTVLRQIPGAGALVEVGSLIEVIVAQALPKIPNVIGLTQKQAAQALENRGFDINVRRQASGSPAGTVISQSPTGGTAARPGRTVMIVIAKPEPPPCHPSYTGRCLDPNASDYDCIGGSGDGPKYTGTVQVIGPDVFELDGDGDGTGCD